MQGLTDKAKEFKKALIDKEISQREIAEHLNITPQAVNNRLKRGSLDKLKKAVEELEDA